MTKKQTNTSNNLPQSGKLGLPPRMSIFDKKGQASMARIAKLPNMPHNPAKVNLPQVRINQHKGA